MSALEKILNEINELIDKTANEAYLDGYKDGLAEGYDNGYEAGWLNDCEDYGCVVNEGDEASG